MVIAYPHKLHVIIWRWVSLLHYGYYSACHKTFTCLYEGMLVWWVWPNYRQDKSFEAKNFYGCSNLHEIHKNKKLEPLKFSG